MRDAGDRARRNKSWPGFAIVFFLPGFAMLADRDKNKNLIKRVPFFA